MGDESTWESQHRTSLMVLRIIVFALAMGCLTFMLIALVTTGGKMTWESLSLQKPISFVGLAMIVPFFGGWLIVPPIIEAAQRRMLLARLRQSASASIPPKGDRRPQLESQVEPLAFWGIYQARTIAAAAIVEGATFLLLVAFFVEHSAWTLLAAGALTVAILLHMPTNGRMMAWADRQWQRIANDLDLG